MFKRMFRSIAPGTMLVRETPPAEVSEDAKGVVDMFFPRNINHVRADFHLGAPNRSSLTVRVEPCPNSDELVRMSVAVCSGNDNFSREVGREITQNRLDSGNYITVNRNDVTAATVFSTLTAANPSHQVAMIHALMFILRTGSYQEGPAWEFSPLRYFFRKIGMPLKFEVQEAEQVE